MEDGVKALLQDAEGYVTCLARRVQINPFHQHVLPLAKPSSTSLPGYILLTLSEDCDEGIHFGCWSMPYNSCTPDEM